MSGKICTRLVGFCPSPQTILLQPQEFVSAVINDTKRGNSDNHQPRLPTQTWSGLPLPEEDQEQDWVGLDLSRILNTQKRCTIQPGSQRKTPESI